MDSESGRKLEKLARAARETALTSGELSENAKVVLQRRYLAKDRKGKMTETPDGMFRRVARNLSQAELNYGASDKLRSQVEEEFYRVMRNLEFLPNSPTLMNAGRKLQQLSACFVLPVEDSLEGIFSTVKQTALIHQSGGGTGFSFSRLRPEGDIVGSTGGVASGPVSFINVFDATTDVAKQGSTRRGANMGILDVTHPDIIKFIRSKEDGQRLNNFNISVGVTEAFMEKEKRGEDYDLINPRTGQLTGKQNDREVFKLIAELAWQTGDPGIVFLDRINRDNPNPQLGNIESTNPCGEQALLPYESCNLGSINLACMLHHGPDKATINWKRLGQVVYTAVRLLDNVIDMNDYPIEEIARMSRDTRRIGVGVMGWADMLVQMGVRYDSDEALELAREVMKFIQEQTHGASEDLAEERGNFPAWEDSVYNQAENRRPMRNLAPVTIAPTGTISIIAGASSGIEPLFALSYARNVMDGTRLVELNPYFETLAHHEGFYSDELMEQLMKTANLEKLDLPQWVKDVFRTSREIEPKWHVLMQAAFQAHVDNSVSKTVNLPAEATREDVQNAYLLAYLTNCKGITVYRDGSRAEQVLNVGRRKETDHQTQDGGATTLERPRLMNGVTERFRTGHGNMYITLNLRETGKPFELFANLGKAGGCDSAQLEAVSRMASLALRSGVDPGEIIYNLGGITCCPAWDDGKQVKSAPDAMAHMLRRHWQPEREAENDGTKNGGYGRVKCPDCNTNVEFREGCETCPAPGCGWNRCF